MDDDAPVILSPENNGMYEIVAGVPSEYQKILFKASTSLESRKLHWFLDSELFASSTSGSQVFYAPEIGKHELICIDDLGRSNRISFEIR
jgi:penicillin-binding protein 1C